MPTPKPLCQEQNLIYPALITPYTPDGRLDEASLERLIDQLYREGVGGLYVAGSTGEGVFLPVEIRRRLLERSVELSRGRGRVVVHVGATSGLDAVALARHAAQVGADAISSIPPSFGGYSWPEVVEFYRQLVAAGEGLPVIGYYIPGLTKTEATLDQLAEVAALPGVGGFKYTDHNFYRLQRLVARFRPDQVMFNGPDEMLALGLRMGAHGGIGTTYNFMPRAFVEIARLIREGQPTLAVALQKRVNEVIEILLGFNGWAATKQILVWQGHIDHPALAPPRGMLTDAARAELRRRLAHTLIGDTLVK